MDLAAVIVNYHSGQPLRTCLATLADTTRHLATEVVIVNNSPGDHDAESAARPYPAARWIENADNLGFARAVNQGIAATSAPFVLVINPDCEVRADAVDVLLARHRSEPRTGIAAPRILDPDGSLQLSARCYPGPLTFLFNRYSLLTRLFPRNPWSRRYLLSDWDHASVRDVDWVAGACMCVRREAIREVGPFDEAFFMFNEDVDWCRRMNQAGWKVTYVPDAVVIHHVGASKRRVSSKVIVERHRGMLHYFRKHHRPDPVTAALIGAVVMARAVVMLALNALRLR
jgi:GT2 family glycosyltransferase